MHFRNNRLLRWPRFLFWNSFPLSCRAQILTKRSLMAFLLFKTSQSSSSHPHTTSSGWNCAESILFSLPILISHKTAHSKHNLGNRLCVWNTPSPLSSWKTFTNSILQKKWINSWTDSKLPLSVTLTKHLFFLRPMKNKWLYNGDASFALPPVSESKDYVDAFLPKNGR